MAKKVKQSQIQGPIVQSVTGTGVDNTDPLNPVVTVPPEAVTVESVSVTGTTTKTLTITFSDESTISATFTDLNTTYSSMTAQQLETGTSTTAQTIAAKVLADYVNSRLSTVYKYKGSVEFGDLPSSGLTVGDTYNITNSFTLGGLSYPAGTNVSWNGTAWDALAGSIDVSAFLTEETDPKGVKSLAISGTTTKTVEITLNDDSVVSATFTDEDTNYPIGTLSLIRSGTSTAKRYWSAEVLNRFVFESAEPVVDVFVIVAGDIDGSVVTLTLTSTPHTMTNPVAYQNGVRLPKAAVTKNGNSVEIDQSKLADAIEPGDEVEVVYRRDLGS